MTTIAERNQRPHFVYDIRGPGGRPLYVGCTRDLVGRFWSHERKPWWRDVVDVHTEKYPTRDVALAAERALIEKLQPRYNQQFTEQGHRRRREAIARRQALQLAAALEARLTITPHKRQAALILDRPARLVSA